MSRTGIERKLKLEEIERKYIGSDSIASIIHQQKGKSREYV